VPVDSFGNFFALLAFHRQADREAKKNNNIITAVHRADRGSGKIDA